MQLIKKYFSILDKENKNLFWILVTLISLSLFIEVLSLGSLIPFFQIILSDNSDNFFNLIIEKLNIPKGNLVFISILIMGLIFLIKTLFIIYVAYFKHNFIYELSCSLSKRILQNYESSTINNNFSFKNSETNRLVLIDVSMTAGGVHQLCNALSEIIVIIASLSILIILEPIIISFFFTISLLIFFLYKFFYKKKIVSWGESRKYFDTIRRSQLFDLINSLLFSKLIGIKNTLLDKYLFSNRQTAYYYQLRERWNEIPRSLLEFIAIVFILILFTYFYIKNYSVNQLIPILSIFTLASLKIIISLNRLIVSINQIFFSLPALDRVYSNAELVDYKKIDKRIKKDYNFQKLSFENVSFSYGNNFLFKNLNFNIQKKDFVGISGQSGVGKTTLLSLIMGLHHPSEGKIYYNGKEKNKIGIKIGYVGQTHNLIEGSIAENIAFGIKYKNINFDRIQKLTLSLGLNEFISNLPEKLNSIISEKSSNLSMGQAQRIAIARALYFDPPVLIFDEPTSSLDEKNELEVIKIIQKLSKSKTIFIVSHKSKNLKYCNKLITLTKNSFKIKEII